MPGAGWGRHRHVLEGLGGCLSVGGFLGRSQGPQVSRWACPAASRPGAFPPLRGPVCLGAPVSVVWVCAPMSVVSLETRG